MALALLAATGAGRRRPLGPPAPAPAAPARPLLLAGALIALAWLGVKYVPLGAVIAGAWAWRFRADRRALATAAGVAAVAAAHFAWWHLHTFGGLTPYTTNVVWSGEGTASILASHLELRGRLYRLHGLFTDARFGLLRWLPAAVLVVAASRWRTRLPYLAVLAVCVLMGTFVSITMMGWWFPGRMLVAGFPALVVLVALGAARLPRTAAVLGLWSLAIAAAVVWSARTGGIRLAVDPFTLGVPLAPAGLFPDFRSFPARTLVAAAAWLVALAGLAWALRGGPAGRRPRPWRRRPFSVQKTPLEVAN
ncbi:MAG: hypothetical protein ACT4PX_05715 [Actinomycetota bacterium]